MKASEKSNLGRGLSALMGIVDIKSEVSENNSRYDVIEVPINDILINSEQPRKSFDAESLQELALSIKQKGIISPILVRRKEQNKFEIIAGERRYRAAQFAKLATVPVLIKDMEDIMAFEVALIENIQRQDLNIIEEASAYKSLLNKHSYNYNEISEITGKSRSHITNIIRLLALPEKVLELLACNMISMGHARALIGSPNAEMIADRIVKQGLSVRQVENLVSTKDKNKTSLLSIATGNNFNDDIKAIEDLLSKKLHSTVNIKQKDENTGSISIAYKSLGELDKILQLLSK